MFDVALCDDCGTTFDALQSAANALDEALPLSVVIEEMCSVCLSAMRAAVGMD